MLDKLQEYRFYSKVLLIFTAIMIGLIMVFFTVHAYQQNLKNAEAHELRTLHGIAKTLALNIDGDLHQQLVCSFLEKDAIKANAENAEYLVIHELLKKTQNVNELATPIYTLFKSSACPSLETSSEKFLFGVSSSNPYFRHSYNSPPKILELDFEKGGKVGEYYDDHGHWLSAFFPIKNSLGETVAVVQADESFCSFAAEAKATLLYDSIYALGFLAIVCGIFIYIYNLILKSMSNVNVTLEAAVTKRTQDLNKSNHALQKLTEKLENLVEERTNELRSTNLQLKDSNEKLKSFAHVASHDLRAPLRLIKSFAQLFQRKYKNVIDEGGKEYLDYITTNTQKMSDLISDILSTSLLQSENGADLKMVDLNEVMNDVVANLQVDIASSKAQVQYHNLPSIKGYSSEFLQLFQNFTSNSIKYCCPTRPPIVDVYGEKIDDYFSIKISDNGKGISKEALKNIFEKFNRGDATDDEGYGIGLSTCKRIIKDYGGKLEVFSEVGVGTTFEFALKNRQSATDVYEEAVDASMGMAMKN